MSHGHLCGILNLAKPAGVTSRDVVDRIAKMDRSVKVGHAGTLDPLAEGVLLVAVGAATRLISFMQEGTKEYVGTFQLGLRTDTEDITGQVLSSIDPGSVSREQLLQQIPSLLGNSLQVPPQFSAIHVQGERAYQRARRGEHSVIEARPIRVDSIDLIDFSPPRFTLRIRCGKGTYVRSLGRDLGDRLGCGATMCELTRTAIGPFRIEQALPLDRVTLTSVQEQLHPPIQAVIDFPRVALDAEQVRDARNGKRIRIAEPGTPFEIETIVALVEGMNQLVGMAVVAEDRSLQPKVILPQ